MKISVLIRRMCDIFSGMFDRELKDFFHVGPFFSSWPVRKRAKSPHLRLKESGGVAHR